MLGVEWSTEVGESFTESLPLISEKESNQSRMFHGTIDLIGSSDDDYESDLVKLEEAADQNEDAGECDVILQVDEDVKKVVSDIVDFVERNTLFPEFGFDPDGMAKPVDVVLREGSCMKPHCQLGCLCSSLRGAFQHVPTHCSRERCIFECHCQEKGLSAIDDESHYADKSKRKKKIPNRFRDVVLGRAYKKLHARTIHDASSPGSESESDYESSLLPAYKKTSPVSSPPKVPSPEPKKDGNGLVQPKVDNSWILSDKIANIKRTIQERRVGFVANTMAEDQTLADVNIWCSQHNKYSCLCINYVYFSKTNYLLWKPSNKSRYLANKVMFEILLKEPSHNEIPYEVFPYNRNNHCARTYGALLDYKARNTDEIFTAKRKLELEHKVLSYSNSYVKFKNFLLVKASPPVPSAEPYNKHEKKRSMGKLVNIVKTPEKVKVDVGEENLDVRVNYQLDDDVNSEEEEEHKTKVSGRKRKLTQKMKDLEEERKREKEAELEDMKKIEEEIRLRKAMEEVPAKVPKKRGRPPKPKPGVEVPNVGKASDVERSMREPTPEVELIKCKKNGLKFGVGVEKKEEEFTIKQEPVSPGHGPESRPDVEAEPGEINSTADRDRHLTDRGAMKTHFSKSSKTLKDCIEEFRDETPKPFLGFSDCDDNSESEDCDSDLDSVHSKKVLALSPRSDGYPHLGLMCLTPGIGYLSVTESLRGRIVVVDPIDPARRHTFNSIRHANEWLNGLFRSKANLSRPDLDLQWILVTPGVLKVKRSKPLSAEIFQHHVVITRDGPVRLSSGKNLNVANNCSLLRKQLSEHSVFRPLIRKQLAMREETVARSLRNPKFPINGSRWIPNPKFGMKKVERNLPTVEKRFQPSDTVSLHCWQNAFFDASIQRLPAVKEPSPGVKQPSDAQPQVTLRPLPNLTKILSKQPATKLHPGKC